MMGINYLIITLKKVDSKAFLKDVRKAAALDVESAVKSEMLK